MINKNENSQNNKIVIVDFGGQYANLIYRRIRDSGVCADIIYPEDFNKINKKNIKGIILSGSSKSVYEKDSPKMPKRIFNLGLPVLGICYGFQLICFLEGGEVKKGVVGEYGSCKLNIIKNSLLFSGIKKKEFLVWMNHSDFVYKLPKDYEIIALTDNSLIAGFQNRKKNIYGVQFHPEVVHTKNGFKIINNFLFKICKVKKDFHKVDIKEEIYREIKSVLGDKKAIIGLSGGVDSSTAAIMVNNVVGKNLIAVYVDTGLMRKGDKEFILREFSKYNLNLRIIDAKERFLNALKGVRDPEKKRKIIGKLFIKIFESVALKENAEFFIQGTIYSDRIESGLTKNSSVIKSHHNVGALPKNIKLKIYEPLRNLYKDEVRKLALELGLSNAIINRHVFPGPGLAIRIVGKISKEKINIVRKANFIIEEELKKSGFYNKVWMGFAVLLPVKSVGIKGDSRDYGYVVCVRIVESKDAMTANFSRIPYDVLERISARITSEIKKVNRVVYDISNKPPSTIEWE
jgi:GMP synthase (glutamine-hydrolysing)